MIVKCVGNLGMDLPPEFPSRYKVPDNQYGLIINTYYIVYGMTESSGYIWYSICDKDYSYYPVWSPAPLFEVTNGRLSKYWLYSFFKKKDWTYSILTFSEWAENPYYYDSLTDGEKKEVGIFKRYKTLMDLEFPNPSITDKATIYDKDWVGCPLCVDAWHSLSKDGMVICPTCQGVLHNPFYEDQLVRLT